MAARARAEFLIEPFVEGRPGPHVQAGVAAVDRLEPDIGPFGTTIEAPVDDVAAAIADLIRAALDNGGTRIQLLVERGRLAEPARLGDLHGALDRMIAAVEQELECSLADLDREGKQASVRMLAARGAFLLRKAVEEVADRMGVSRMSVYNYLNAIEDER
ncbi:MAG: helix-turn-helix domain-containing protein [Acidimicrobiia bacterium]|nr:helix-turn-helix domain-containing protein [Acidimicrobiia bacterium]